MNVAVIGVGYWGPNLVRNCLENRQINEVHACDIDPDRLDDLKAKYPAIRTGRDCAALLSDDNIDGVLIATPMGTHFELAKQALSAGKHVIVEKPLATTHADASELVELAENKGLTLMVDHTFIYTPAVRKIKEIMVASDFGTPYYFDSVRINLGLFQSDLNVIWDLASHDFSIMGYLLDNKPRTISATGAGHIPGNLENIAYVHVGFDDQLIAHFHLNWLSPVKIRKIIIAGEKNMITYDDLEPLEKVRIYDSGVTLKDQDEIYKSLVQYRTGDMVAPQIENREALSIMIEHFVDCVESGQQPITDGQSAVDVVRLLESASLSMRDGGKVVTL